MAACPRPGTMRATVARAPIVLKKSSWRETQAVPAPSGEKYSSHFKKTPSKASNTTHGKMKSPCLGRPSSLEVCGELFQHNPPGSAAAPRVVNPAMARDETGDEASNGAACPALLRTFWTVSSVGSLRYSALSPRRIQSCNRLLHHCLASGDLVSTPAYLTLEEVVARYRGQVSEGRCGTGERCASVRPLSRSARRFSIPSASSIVGTNPISWFVDPPDPCHWRSKPLQGKLDHHAWLFTS